MSKTEIPLYPNTISINRNGDVIRNGACLEPRVILKAPDGQGCPRCGGWVYAAEQMLARGRVSILSHMASIHYYILFF